MEPHRRVTDNIDIDHKTSRSICDEVGERLQRTFISKTRLCRPTSTV
jgi:hypothetical protein